MIKVLLWDIDGTVLDFLAAEKCAVRKGFERFGLGECTDTMIAEYSAINVKHWQMLERGEITKAQVLRGRYEEFFALEHINFKDIDAFNKEYQIFLGDTICFFDNGFELIADIKPHLKQYAVTNGTKAAQSRKLSRSKLIDLFDGVFISEEVGYEKPKIEFFDKVLGDVGNYAKDEIMIVGDSLTSDMRGGNNAGIKCCWYNPKRLPLTESLKIDYNIGNLNELRDILGI